MGNVVSTDSIAAALAKLQAALTDLKSRRVSAVANLQSVTSGEVAISCGAIDVVINKVPGNFSLQIRSNTGATVADVGYRATKITGTTTVTITGKSSNNGSITTTATALFTNLEALFATSIDFIIRENGRIWQGSASLSASGITSALWAQRVV